MSEQIEQQIADLEAAIASGVRRVVTQSNGVRTEVEYQSTEQMERALVNLRGRLGSHKPRTILAEF
jgi:hypothetical protein